jgi:hypothetical protein
LLESRDGSENVVTQTVYGTQYVDEIVRWWRDGRGAMYVLQGERSECLRAPTGKADTMSASGSQAWPGGSEHDASPWRANWNVTFMVEYDASVFNHNTPYASTYHVGSILLNRRAPVIHVHP